MVPQLILTACCSAYLRNNTQSLLHFSGVEVVPSLFVLSLRFDRTLGGLEMELRLRDYLAKLFNDQHPSKDVRQNARAMAKLLKEANRLKTVLSANADHMAQV